MERVAFRLRLKPEAIEEYEREHTQVCPDLLAKLKEVGVRQYSIFRRGQDLFLCMRVRNFNHAWEELDKDPANRRWQNKMRRLFEPIVDLQPGERVALMKEVFYLE